MLEKNYFIKLNIITLIFGAIGIGLAYNMYTITEYNLDTTDYAMILVTLVLPIAISIIANTILRRVFHNRDNKKQYILMYSIIFHITTSIPYIYILMFCLVWVPVGVTLPEYIMVLVPILIALSSYVYTYIFITKEYKK